MNADLLTELPSKKAAAAIYFCNYMVHMMGDRSFPKELKQFTGYEAK
jgi:hypothetical protein